MHALSTNSSPVMTIDGMEFYKIPPIPNYAISRCGAVVSLNRNSYGKRLNAGLNRGGYLNHRLSKKGSGGRVKFSGLVHRLLAYAFLGACKFDVIDHIDRDRQNNSLSNLRIATSGGNNQNRSKRDGTTSKHKGVYVHNLSGRFRARIRDGARMRHLGYFDCEDAAGRAYDDAARQLFGDFACLNFSNN